MEEITVKKANGREEWNIEVIKRGKSYFAIVHSMKEVTEKLTEMTAREYKGE